MWFSNWDSLAFLLERLFLIFAKKNIDLLNSFYFKTIDILEIKGLLIFFFSGLYLLQQLHE